MFGAFRLKRDILESSTLGVSYTDKITDTATFHTFSLGKNFQDNKTTFLNVLGIDYYFTNDLWILIYSQHNSSTDRIYFYGLFGWRFKPPFGAVYLIYNLDNYYDFDVDNPIHSNILFLKLTYPIPVIRR